MAAPANPHMDARVVRQHIVSLLGRLLMASIEQESRLDITAFAPDQIHNATREALNFGIITVCLGLAVSTNIVASDIPETVIGTGHESSRGEQARTYWAEDGEVVSRHIDLYVRNLRETLQENVPAVDMLLLNSELFIYTETN